jgi:hypothetical protein
VKSAFYGWASVTKIRRKMIFHKSTQGRRRPSSTTPSSCSGRPSLIWIEVRCGFLGCDFFMLSLQNSHFKSVVMKWQLNLSHSLLAYTKVFASLPNWTSLVTFVTYDCNCCAKRQQMFALVLLITSLRKRQITRVARFFTVQHTKTGEKYTKWPNIYQMAIKYTKCHKIYTDVLNSKAP